MKKYDDLVAELEDLADAGPSMADVSRANALETLLERVLENLSRPPMAPVVNLPAQGEVVVKIPEIIVPAAQVVFQPPPRVLDWTFDFVRNPDGTIKSIRAKAT